MVGNVQFRNIKEDHEKLSYIMFSRHLYILYRCGDYLPATLHIIALSNICSSLILKISRIFSGVPVKKILMPGWSPCTY